MSLAPTQSWWTAAEIAAAGLADMPATRQGVDLLAKRLGWRADPAHARRRQGKGGGWEYPLFWAIALVAQAMLGSGAFAVDTMQNRKSALSA